MKNYHIIGFSIFFMLAIFVSCQRNTYVTDPGVLPNFSTDTVQFDTVFQSVGSATQYFMVYNPYSKPMQISSVELARGNVSPFRINFNGISSTKITDITIPGNDSIYVFTEVTIDPADNALLEKDSLIFYTNGNYSDVKLIAFGQDVHLLNDSVVGTGVWTADKPYLITNSMAVDEDAVLTIEPGCNLHFSSDSRLIVLGTLIAEGTAEEPIIFQGARLEEVYDDVPGQWTGIWFTKLSKDNYLNHALIKNAHIGIQVDSVQNSNPMLTIYNTRIQHHSLFGIYAQMSTIMAANILIADCGRNAIALTRGGAYRFYHSTIANYWRTTVRTSPSVLLNNYFVHEGTAYVYNLSEAYFGNCIITGSVEDEIAGDFYTEGVEVNYMFDNCLLRISEDNDMQVDDDTHFLSPLVNINPKLKAVYDYDFTLDTLSPLKDVAKLEIIQQFPAVLQTDLLNQSRLADDGPDLGAYERIE